MASVIFYEKTGCQGNARQKALLEAAGHTVTAKDLRKEHWTREKLLDFFDALPVTEWFHPSAPAIKSGEIVPVSLQQDREAALAMLLAQPLLIRRPLMEVGAERCVGFNPDQVDAWIGLKGVTIPDGVEGCGCAEHKTH